MDIEIVYLAGPMSGYPEYNFPRFHKLAANLRNKGFVVLSPAETADGVTHLPREWYFRYDFGLIDNADAVVVMPGWYESKGAKAEVMYATETGTPVFLYDAWHGLGSRVEVYGWDLDFNYNPDARYRRPLEGRAPSSVEHIRGPYSSREQETQTTEEEVA